MTTPDRPNTPDLRAITEARLTDGPRGRAVSTSTALAFALDHARAREAVTSELDLPRIRAALSKAGLATCTVTSAAAHRATFITRPDLGRILPPDAGAQLAPHGPADVAIVLGDGLSAVAAILNGPAFCMALAQALRGQGLTVAPIVIAQQARVALGDGIALAMQAQTVVMALGERPGLSASDSLGVYITHQPTAQTADSGRNCLSNIRAGGLQVADAATQACALILAMRKLGQSGVALSTARSKTAQLPPDS
ncbi:MAG: ethanolamine ammonia-lyase subunit EutC [Pseudomonadota bacterium]